MCDMKNLNIKTAFFFLACLMMSFTAVAQNDDWEDDSYNDDGYDDSYDDNYDDGYGDDSYDDPYSDQRRNNEPKTEVDKYRDRINDHCEDKKGYRQKAKAELQPYTYSNGKTGLLKSRRDPKLESFVVPVYYDYQHSIVINTEGVQDNVNVKVFDGPRNDDDRKQLFQTEEGTNINTFELAKDFDKSKIYIEYLVPPNDPQEETIEKGCIVFVMGYLDEAAAEFQEQKGDSEE